MVEPDRLIKIDCYLSDGCPSESGLRKNISEALFLESLEANLSVHKVSEAEADKIGIKGSPSVFLNGIDILPGEIPGLA